MRPLSIVSRSTLIAARKAIRHRSSARPHWAGFATRRSWPACGWRPPRQGFAKVSSSTVGGARRAVFQVHDHGDKGDRLTDHIACQQKRHPEGRQNYQHQKSPAAHCGSGWLFADAAPSDTVRVLARTIVLNTIWSLCLLRLRADTRSNGETFSYPSRTTVNHRCALSVSMLCIYRSPSSTRQSW